MSAIRVVIADDHPLYRDGLRASLNAVEDIDVVGEAETGDQAVDQALRTSPDVVVMDLHMPGCNGIEATRKIHARKPSVAILMLTMFDDDDSLFAAVRAGARGYLLKGAREADLIRAVRAASSGEAIFGPGIADRILRTLTEPPPQQPESAFPQLSTRELEVLDHLARGRTYSEVATTLGVAPKTVRNHVSNILTKLQVTDRSQAVIRARDAGLGRS